MEKRFGMGLYPIDTNFRNASESQKVPSDFSASSRGVVAYRNLLDYLIKLQKRPLRS